MLYAIPSCHYLQLHDQLHDPLSYIKMKTSDLQRCLKREVILLKNKNNKKCIFNYNSVIVISEISLWTNRDVTVV